MTPRIRCTRSDRTAPQAIIDARTLAWSLALEPTPEAVLAAYEDVRRPATAAIVLSNRKVQSELCMELAEERAPDGFDDVNDVFAPGELEAIATEFKRLAGFDPAILNERRRSASTAASGGLRRRPSAGSSRSSARIRQNGGWSHGPAVGFGGIVAASATDRARTSGEGLTRRRRSAQRPSLTVQPPSTAMIWPVICALASPQSQATRRRCRRPAGSRGQRLLALGVGDGVRVGSGPAGHGVITSDGATTFERMPSRA